MSNELWRAFGDWMFFACAISAAVFVILYAVSSPWWQTSMGRNIMAVMGTMAAAFSYFAWVILSGGVPEGFWVARALLFTSIFSAITHRIVLLARHQVLARLRNKETKDEQMG